MGKKKILVIEDEYKILVMIKNYLEKENFEVLTAHTGEEGREQWKREDPDLVLLDLRLPGINGLDICREIRANSSIPIIMLTAKSQETDKILGLEMGADDYITKPFSLAELTARIRAIFRRTDYNGSRETDSIDRGDIQVDFNSVEVKVRGEVVGLTPTEFKILGLLIQNPGRVFSRLQLLNAALGDTYSGYERSIDTHIRNLRSKVEEDPSHPLYIKTVHGLGYKFEKMLPVKEDPGGG